MYRAKRLSILLIVLIAACIAVAVALRVEERREQIANSGEVVLEIDPDDVESISWTIDGQTLSFHLGESGWLYDDDEAFPVDAEKIQSLLELFASFSAAFVITDVEDFEQYGLDDPAGTIVLTTAEQTWEIQLGDYSTMDEQRYVSTGDGSVYLALTDPLDSFSTELSSMIDNDEIPDWDTVTALTFSGSENYTIFYEEDAGISYSAEDVYYTESDEQTLPLDTSRVESYLNDIRYLSLGEYVTYNVTDEELAAYGLDDPELTVTVNYADTDADGQTASGTLVLHISRDPAQLETAAEEDAETDAAASDADSEDAAEEIIAYVRVGESQIVYSLDALDYESLICASYNDLRHRAVFWGSFADVTQLDITLEDTDYTITVQAGADTESEDDAQALIYTYQDEEIDITSLESALTGLEADAADAFTDETPSQQLEIGVMLHLNSETHPTVQIELYRYDGVSCLAVVDGEPVSLIPREQAVELMEAVRAIVLQ